MQQDINCAIVGTMSIAVKARNFFNYISIVRTYLLGYGDPKCCDSSAVSFLKFTSWKNNDEKRQNHE